MKKSVFLFLSCFLLLGINTSYGQNLEKSGNNKECPKIVNIINFIRLLEPRDSRITEDVLYQTVVQQLQLMRKCKLGGTFLLQYDALIDPRYQDLLKKLPVDSFEIGAWWEIPQPLVEGVVTLGIGTPMLDFLPGITLRSGKNLLMFICQISEEYLDTFQNRLVHGFLIFIP